MKFKDFKYERPNYDEVKVTFEENIAKMNNATSYEAYSQAFKAINKVKNDISTMQELVGIRHSIDTTDEFYDQENDYWDENGPMYEELNNQLNKVIINSKFKDDMAKEYGKQFINIIEFSLKAFSPEIIEDLQEENKLVSQYDKLIASAKINFDNKELNLSQMRPYTLDTNRETRKSASEATWKFFEENEDKFDEIYDQLVTKRDLIARKLGFNNYVELGYVRMMRTDYDANMVNNFREQVLEGIVPSATKLYERQKERLGLDKINYYDEGVEFLSGNATPKGNPEFILENGKKMYEELSPETNEFFNFMVESELLDLEAKKGKQAGGYCTYISNYNAPFIFSNFNGTSDDIDVLTHEAGHAFQVYSSRGIEIDELMFPTYESCEIHSMSMEFITWPWMENFFKEDTEKYKFAHLGSAIKFIPYGVTVDAFQHFVYANPTATKEERKMAWREIEKKLLPHRDYTENEFLDRGTYWYKQGHIFSVPFYYIDYTLAQICALQFWKNIREDRDNTWQDYLNLCRVGGTKSFLELVELANLKSPFEDGCVDSVIGTIDEWLEQVDDKAL